MTCCLCLPTRYTAACHFRDDLRRYNVSIMEVITTIFTEVFLSSFSRTPCNKVTSFFIPYFQFSLGLHNLQQIMRRRRKNVLSLIISFYMNTWCFPLLQTSCHHSDAVPCSMVSVTKFVKQRHAALWQNISDHRFRSWDRPLCTLIYLWLSSNKIGLHINTSSALYQLQRAFFHTFSI